MQTLSQGYKQTLSGTWHNQHGSQIDLVALDDGRLTGNFTLRCDDPQEAEQFSLTGFVNKDIITFCVDFGRHESLTAWVGQITTSLNSFETMWQMVADAHRNPCRSWRAVCTGSDTFERGECPENFTQSQKPASHPLWSGVI
jgi:hypothetical protein